jgi:hypothetical protein
VLSRQGVPGLADPARQLAAVNEGLDDAVQAEHGQGRGGRGAKGEGLSVSDAFRVMMTRIARKKARPFEPLVRQRL